MAAEWLCISLTELETRRVGSGNQSLGSQGLLVLGLTAVEPSHREHCITCDDCRSQWRRDAPRQRQATPSLSCCQVVGSDRSLRSGKTGSSADQGLGIIQTALTPSFPDPASGECGPQMRTEPSAHCFRAHVAHCAMALESKLAVSCKGWRFRNPHSGAHRRTSSSEHWCTWTWRADVDYAHS